MPGIVLDSRATAMGKKKKKIDKKNPCFYMSYILKGETNNKRHK